MQLPRTSYARSYALRRTNRTHCHTPIAVNRRRPRRPTGRLYNGRCTSISIPEIHSLSRLYFTSPLHTTVKSSSLFGCRVLADHASSADRTRHHAAAHVAMLGSDATASADATRRGLGHANTLLFGLFAGTCSAVSRRQQWVGNARTRGRTCTKPKATCGPTPAPQCQPHPPPHRPAVLAGAPPPPRTRPGREGLPRSGPPRGGRPTTRPGALSCTALKPKIEWPCKLLYPTCSRVTVRYGFTRVYCKKPKRNDSYISVRSVRLCINES